jgi:hypothetical protein
MDRRMKRLLLFLFAALLASACTAGRGGRTEKAAPTNVQARALSPFHAGIGWEDRSGGTAAFVVQRRTAGGEWTTVAELPPGSHYALDLGLEPRTRYQVRVGAAGDGAAFSEEVTLETGRSLLPPARVRALSPELMQPGLTLLSIEDPDYIGEFSALLAVDEEGRPVWMVGDERFLVITDFDILPWGTLLVMTGSGMEEVTPGGERLWHYEARLLHHDIDPTPWGTIMAIVGYGETIGGMLLSADALLELDPGTRAELGAWPLREAVAPYEFCPICFWGDDYFYGRDWTHANAIEFDPDMEHLYLSVRNLNRVYKLSVSTGRTVWVLGDGGDFGQGLFSHQHEPQILDDGHLLLFDNGLHRPGRETFSRVVEIELDEEARLARIVWEYREKPDFYTSIGGDADRLPNGNTLITDSMNGRVIEISPLGDLVWEYRLGFPYRIYKAVRVGNFPP